MPKVIRLLICDDHAVVRRGLRSLVSVKPEMELIGEAVDGEEAVVMAKKLKPDVIIITSQPVEHLLHRILSWFLGTDKIKRIHHLLSFKEVYRILENNLIKISEKDIYTFCKVAKWRLKKT